MNNNTNNSSKKQKNKAKRATTAEEAQTKNLFQVLPFQNETYSDEEDILYACIDYIPEVAPQLKRVLTKAGVNTTFKSAPKLKDILCGRNKSKPPIEKKKGVYEYQCTCSDKAIYIGQTARSYEIRWEEHGKAIEKQQWHHSGISQHYQHCNHHFNKDNFESIKTMQDKKKRRLTYNLKIREAMEIRRHKSGPGKGLNEDMGAYVKSDIWDPVLVGADS